MPRAVTVAVLAAVIATAFAAGIKVRLAENSTTTSVVALSPTGEEVAASEATPLSGHLGAVEVGGELSSDPETHTDVENMRRILESLPEPEPDILNAMKQKLSSEEMAELLRKVWNRRQAQLKEFLDNIKTDADFMKALINNLMSTAQLTELADPADDSRITVLEDLEFHVGKADNAKDFKTVRSRHVLVSPSCIVQMYSVVVRRGCSVCVCGSVCHVANVVLYCGEKQLGGIAAVVPLMSDPNVHVQEAAVWVIGT